MLLAMRTIAALCLPIALVAVACPGTDSNFDNPKPDAETNPPDAPYQVEAGPPQPVMVMNWNTRNFFDDKRDSPEIPATNPPSACTTDATTPCEYVPSTADYQKKLGQVSSVISKLKPDVVILEEVENQVVIDDLATKLGGYPYRHVTQGNDPRGIDIAVLSQIEVQIGPSHKDELFSASTDPTQQKFAYSRDVLEVHLVVNTRHLTLLGVHFKAQDSDPVSDIKRLAEAEHTRKLATDLLVSDPGSALIVLGDFNCTPGSDPMNALIGADPQFVSATAGLAAADRFSVNYGTPELFDDQILDPHADSLLDSSSVGIEHNDADANAASDHDPVHAIYRMQ